MSLLAIEDLSLRIHGTPILRQVDLTLAAGRTLGVVGESGSGKSLTALAVMGLLPEGAQLSGRIRLQDQTLTDLPEAALCRLRGRRIGMIFQEPMTALNPVQSIGDQVAETLIIHGAAHRAEAGRIATDRLARVGLPPDRFPLSRFPHELSGGQRQRVCIAMAVALRPALLIADEPTTALDVTTQAQILALLKRLVDEEGMALMLITHDLAVVAGLADRVAVMQEGRVVEQDATERLFRAMRHPYTRRLFAASDHRPPRRSTPAADTAAARPAAGQPEAARPAAASRPTAPTAGAAANDAPSAPVSGASATGPRPTAGGTGAPRPGGRADAPTSAGAAPHPPPGAGTTASPGDPAPSPATGGAGATPPTDDAALPIAGTAGPLPAAGGTGPLPGTGNASTRPTTPAQAPALHAPPLPPGTPLLEVERVSRDYALPRRGLLRRRPVFRAVAGVSLRLQPGDSVGLVGESGCGKSTLTRAILGLEAVQEGRIRLAGQPVGPRMPAALRARMQVVFQDPYGSFNPRHRVARLVAEPFHLLADPPRGAARRVAVAAALEAVGLRPADMEKFPHEFSGGQRQRIAIARALLIRPQLIVLDEAVSALDVSVRARILDLLADLQARFGLTYLFISHDLAVVRAITDRVLVMQSGRIVEEGPTARVFDSPTHPYTRQLVAATPRIPAHWRPDPPPQPAP